MDRFRDGGPADVLAPGGELARLAGLATGDGGAVLGTLTEEEILGVLGAGGRLAAWAAWIELVTLAELARRRPAADGAGPASSPPRTWRRRT
jgi:hypothetical protein